MKSFLYLRLAVSGIRKNKKLYLPYLLTCVGMVMMEYILLSLSDSPALRTMRGGAQLGFLLSLGKFVVAVFAALFLLYTNSFLIRRRNKEFGLYNVLGMDKSALGWVIFWENIIVATLGLGLGLLFGIGLYKVAELGLVNIIHADVDYSFIISLESVKFTLWVFLPIFALLMVKSMWQVRRARPWSCCAVKVPVRSRPRPIISWDWVVWPCWQGPTICQSPAPALCRPSPCSLWR